MYSTFFDCKNRKFTNRVKGEFKSKNAKNIFYSKPDVEYNLGSCFLKLAPP